MLKYTARLWRVAILVAGIAGATNLSIADEVSDKAAQHVLAAEEALKSQDYQLAAREYRLAAEVSENADIARQATQVAYSYGLNDDALLAARRWAELAPESDEALIYLAQLYLRTGEIRESRKHFERLLEKDDAPVDERLLALVPVLSREDATNAYELMRQLARPYKDSAKAHYAVAVLALEAGDTETAGERAQAAIELDPDWLQPHLLYSRSLLLSGDEEGAIDYAARLVGDDPDPDPEARLELAIMLVSAGRDDDALSQVNQVLLEQPYRSDALRLMAIINFRLDYLDVAKSDFEDLLASGNYTMDALYYLARIADRQSETEEAIRYYAQVTVGSNAIASQTRAAVLLALNGDEDKALAQLARFAEVNPTYAVDMLRARGQLLTSLERYDEALSYFDEVVGYRPDDEGVHLGRAELLLRMGRQEEAIKAYREAVRRWPDSSMSLNALGYTLADRTDRYSEAAKLIRKALKLDPESAAIIDSWGWVLFRQGKHEEALVYLEDAYEKLRDPEVAGHIVEVLWALGRTDEARQALDEADQLFPESSYLSDVRERLFDEQP